MKKSKVNKISNEDKGMLVVLINLLLAECGKDEITFTKKQFMAARGNKFSTRTTLDALIVKVEKKDANSQPKIIR